MNKIKRLPRQVDPLIYNRLEEEKHGEINLEGIFNNKSENFTIVYGQLYDEIYGKKSKDHILAEQLEKEIRDRGGTCSTISDEELNNKRLKKTDEDKKIGNLILLGGTSVNKITREVIPYLPIQYIPIGCFGGLYSRLSYDIYPGPKVALLAWQTVLIIFRDRSLSRD